MYPLNMVKGVGVTHISHYREICQYKVKCQEHLVKAKVGDWQKVTYTERRNYPLRESKYISQLLS
jgi:hypothetical protein